jgi:KDO2-lipid IV(A) lauroyltransferase
MTLLLRLEAAIVAALLWLLGRLNPAAASNLAGRVAAAIGPLLPVTRVARANLRAALPELDDRARRHVIRGMWEQLGRTAGELPHIAALRHNTAAGPGWEVSGEDILAELAARGGPAIFFSGHIGNWEILPRASQTYGLPCASLYRAAQNSAVDALIGRLRRDATGEALKLFPKGTKGARQAMAHLGRGGFLALLVDQKLNEGIEAQFFGLPAMTAPAAASFALHFRCPVVPALARRIGPARLRLVVEPPLALPDTGDRGADILALTQAINDVLERWIRDAPESWMWLHRRWPKSVVRT